MATTDDVMKKWREYHPPLHHESLTFTEVVLKMGLKPINEVTEDEFRKEIDEIYAHFRQQVEYDGSIEDRTVPSNDRKGILNIIIM